MSGYFEIGINNGKTEHNIGTLWRSAYQLGANSIFTIGRRYNKQSSDTYNVPDQIPLREYLTFEEFINNRPKGSILIGVEFGGEALESFDHPKKCIYLLGSEDNGLSKYTMDKCNRIVSIPSVREYSYNVAMAGTIVMYDRYIKELKKG
jgi:tRNA G18 (ribose-2'-O)-methylase SpoU